MFSIYIVITCAFATSMVVVVCKDLSISQVIDHVTCYKFECSHWWKIHFFKKILYRICSPV